MEITDTSNFQNFSFCFKFFHDKKLIVPLLGPISVVSAQADVFAKKKIDKILRILDKIQAKADFC